jgi:outer membrane protein OmpA-like peptidoglycan-associated protein
MKFKPQFFVLLILSTFIFSTICFGQADIPRQTVAITYPSDEVVLVPFRGTTRFPRMKGDAKIRRTKRNGTEIELSVSKMPRPFELGAGYATYVLWAISPDGQVDNLGEIKRRGFFAFDSKISVTTPLQIFALIVTAEPHFLVKQPSRAIMLENLNPTTESGRLVATTKSVSYFGNSSDYFRDSRTPEIAEVDYAKTPSTVLQAQQAIALAKFAGAIRDAPEDLKVATDFAAQAESDWRSGKPEPQVDIIARQAISAAVKAEENAVTTKASRDVRNERSRQDAEVRKIEEKLDAANQEIDNLKAEISREMRNRELAERDGSNFSQQIKDLRDENRKLSEELGRVKLELETSKSKLTAIEEQKRKEAEVTEKARLAEEKRQQLLNNQAVLLSSLRQFGTVRQTEKGIVLSLAETTWTTTRTSIFSANGNAKLSNLSGLLASNVDYRFIIESHTDNSGVPEALQNLTTNRSSAIAERLIAAGIPNDDVQGQGFGANYPVAPNTTAANKGKNRRTEVILVLKDL